MIYDGYVPARPTICSGGGASAREQVAKATTWYLRIQVLLLRWWRHRLLVVARNHLDGRPVLTGKVPQEGHMFALVDLLRKDVADGDVQAAFLGDCLIDAVLAHLVMVRV